jgi:hypothetical protein
MAKNSVNDYSTTAGDNTDIQSINIGEGMAPSNVNNAMRQQMAHIASLVQGAVTATAIKAASFAAQTATITSLVLGSGTYTAVAANRQVVAGLGLSGGGTLEADRTINLDVSDLTATATWAEGDYFPVYRTAATGTYKVLKSDLAASTSALGFERQADQAAMEAGTAGRGVTADVQKFHPAHIKAWVSLNMATSTVRGSFRVSSITKNDTGDFTITLSDTFSSTDGMCVLCTGGGDFAEDSNYESVRAFVASATTIRVYATRQQSGAPVAFDCTRVYVAVLGDI